MRALLLALVPAMLSAAEPLTIEARLAAGILPGVDDLTLDIGLGGSVDLPSDPKVSFGIEPQVVLARRLTPLVGLTGAIGIFFRQHAGEDPNSSDSVTVSAFGLDVAPAVAIHFDPRLWIEVGATVAVGWGKRAVEINGGTDPNYPDGSGLYTSYGARLGAFTLLQERLILGVEVGFLAFTNDDSVDVNGTTIDTTAEGQGVMANVAVGYRF